MTLINPISGAVDFELEGGTNDQVADFRIFGGMDNRVVSVTESKLIHLHIFNVKQRGGCLLKAEKIKFVQNNSDSDDAYTIALTPSDNSTSSKRHLLIQLGARSGEFLLTRILIYEIKETSYLNFVSSYRASDYFSQIQGLHLQLGIAYWGVAKGKLIFHLHCSKDCSRGTKSIKRREDSLILVGFDIKKRNWSVRKDLRYPYTLFGAVYRVVKRGDSVYFAGKGGKVARMMIRGLDKHA